MERLKEEEAELRAKLGSGVAAGALWAGVVGALAPPAPPCKVEVQIFSSGFSPAFLGLSFF